MSQTNHLLVRKGVFYYHRRVPLPLVGELGKKVILFSLGTRDAKEAKKRRAAEDLKWAIRFEAAEKGPGAHGNDNLPGGQPPSDGGLIKLVQDYVERTDERASCRALSDPPASQLEKDEIKADIEIGLDILKNPDDPRSAELAHATGSKILKGVGTTIDNKAVPYDLFTELVRRALLELQNRKHARIDDDFSHGFFDQTFDPRRPADVTFGQAADQLVQVMQEEAAANGVSLKWIDKQRANVALLKEVIGSTTPLRDVDYDTCLKVRSVLAHIPAGRTKAYGGLSIEEARAEI